MFGMYGNPQSQLERWTKIKQDAENEIARLTQPPAAINQNFNIVTPNNNINDFDARFINSYEDVKSAKVNRNTIFMNKNEPVFYMKMVDGEIKTYKFEEVVVMDERDKKILELEQKIDMLLKEGVNNGKSANELDKQKEYVISADVVTESSVDSTRYDKKKSKSSTSLESSSKSFSIQ